MYSQSVVNTGPLLPPAPNARPYGNILFPGGTPIAAPAPRLGSLIPNTGQYQGGIVGPPSRRDGSGGHERTVVVPYAYPVYYNDYGGGGYNNYPQQPPVTVIVPQQQQTVPTVIINQTFTGGERLDPEIDPLANPAASNQSSVRVYRTPVGPAAAEVAPAPRRAAVADDKPTLYLIAYKDASIHSAVGYWVEGATLHYVTQQGTVNRISLDQVDKPLSDQLNSERKVDFQLRVN